MDFENFIQVFINKYNCYFASKCLQIVLRVCLIIHKQKYLLKWEFVLQRRTQVQCIMSRIAAFAVSR